MEASQARPWAEHIRATVKRIEGKDALLEDIRARYDGLKAMRYDKIGGSATQVSGDDALVNLLSEIEQLQKDIVSDCAGWREDVDEFRKAVRLLDTNHDNVLTARFLRGLSWEQVADATGYAEAYVRGELAVNALAALYDVMPRHLRTNIPTAL